MHIVLAFIMSFGYVTLGGEGQSRLRSWLDLHRPFYATQECGEWSQKPGTSTPIVAGIVESAKTEYESALASAVSRFQVDGGLEAEAYRKNAAAWILEVEGMRSVVRDRIRTAAAQEEWRQMVRLEARYCYRRDTSILREAVNSPLVDNIFEVLEQAEIEYEPSMQVNEVVESQTEILAEVAAGVLLRCAREWSQALRATDELSSVSLEEILMPLHQATLVTWSAIILELNQEAADRLCRTRLCRVHSRICIDGPAVNAAKALRGCSIEESQQELISQILSDYIDKRDALLSRFAMIQQSWEEPERRRLRKEEFDREVLASRSPYTAWDDHPGVPVLKELFALEVAACGRMRSVFSVEQWDSLPERARFALEWFNR